MNTHRDRVLRSHSGNDVAAQVRFALHAEHDRPHVSYLLEGVTLHPVFLAVSKYGGGGGGGGEL